MTFRRRNVLRDERGQVLFLALALMVVLSGFVILLANVLFLAAAKVKLQTMADQTALSMATLKARVLNAMTDTNGILETAVTKGGLHPNVPYASPVDAALAVGAMMTAYGINQINIHECNTRLPEALHDMLRGHGFDPQHMRAAASGKNGIGFPAPNATTQSILNEFNRYTGRPESMTAVHSPFLSFMAPPDPLPVPMYPTLPTITQFKPNELPWMTQVRLEWDVRDAVIGGARLGLELPALAARARAEVFDDPAVPGVSYGHHYKVKLAVPEPSVDASLRRDMDSELAE